MPIEKILSEISKTLSEISKILKERLELEKDAKESDREDINILGVLRDEIIKKFGKDAKMQEEMQKELFKMLGIKEKIDIDNLKLGKE